MILRDIQFPVQEATIIGYMLNPDWLSKYGKNENPGLCWEVVVQMEEQILDEDFYSASPRITWGEFSLPLRRWFDIEGMTIHSSDATDREIGEPVGISYFDTHEILPNSTLKFGKRAGNKFEIHGEGTCHPFLGEPLDKDVPFLIQTEAIFKEITVQASQSDTDATTRERLSRYVDPDDFIQHPIVETVRDIPVENRFGIFDPLLRWIFRTPDTQQWVTRYSKFEPRV